MSRNIRFIIPHLMYKVCLRGDEECCEGVNGKQYFNILILTLKIKQPICLPCISANILK